MSAHSIPPCAGCTGASEASAVTEGSGRRGGLKLSWPDTLELGHLSPREQRDRLRRERIGGAPPPHSLRHPRASRLKWWPCETATISVGSGPRASRAAATAAPRALTLTGVRGGARGVRACLHACVHSHEHASCEHAWACADAYTRTYSNAYAYAHAHTHARAHARAPCVASSAPPAVAQF